MAANRAGPVAISRLRTRIRQDRNVSAGYLGLGFTVLGGLLMVRGLFSLGWSWSNGPSRWISLLAWAILVATFIAAVVVARRSGGIIPGRFWRLLTVAGVLAVAVDFAAFALDGALTPFYPTAVIGFGACLFACLPLQPLRRGIAGSIALTVSGSASVLAGLLLDPASLPSAVTGLLLGLTPVVAGITMIGAADRYLARKIDQAVTESLVTAPALGLGVAAASELRRLDRDAERLLSLVAELPAAEPIDDETAARAETLSDELRLALVADHEQTWLQIAVAESDHLSRTVTIDDPAVLAARLEPAQRRNLLALAWLSVAQATAPALDIAFVDAPHSHTPGAASRVVFSITGTRRRGIDPGVWPLFSRLGHHTIVLGADRASVTVDVSPSTRPARVSP
ncbi:hypothetical protein B7R23_13105 [Subtercola boreus]|nr:hypothetical protein B7R24_13125 [Subtercola boreus]RFA19205.1 hypothetical protein B7R23_13105 [Subtercola boreus]